VIAVGSNDGGTAEVATRAVQWAGSVRITKAPCRARMRRLPRLHTLFPESGPTRRQFRHAGHVPTLLYAPLARLPTRRGVERHRCASRRLPLAPVWADRRDCIKKKHWAARRPHGACITTHGQGGECRPTPRPLSLQPTIPSWCVTHRLLFAPVCADRRDCIHFFQRAARCATTSRHAG
jgi:hypothetical protein